MEKIINPQLIQDPDKELESSAINSYIQQLDNTANPPFIAHMSDLRHEQVSRQYTISMYEAIARQHGKNIIPQLSEIMKNVLKVLSTDAPSLALQHACAKVVSALARYTVDPSSFEGRNESVIRDLSYPLLEVLLGNVQSLAEGAATCLRALVKTEAWKFAQDDIVNEVCLRVTGALEEKGTQTTAHIKLVCSLAKHNSLILEAYGRSLLKAAAEILDNGNWQLRLHAMQMIDTLLKSVDSDILASEVPNTIGKLEKCRSDRMPSIRNSALETLRVAKAVASKVGIDVNYDNFSSEGGIAIEDMTSQNNSHCGIGGFTQDTQMDSYPNSPVSSWHSFNTKYQTPSMLGSAAIARRSSFVSRSQGYYSDSIDENSISGTMSNSMRPNAGTDMTTEQTPCSFLNQRGKDRDTGGYFVQKSKLFNEEGDITISSENGIVSENAVVVECEGDGGASGRNYPRGYRRTGLAYEKECLEKKHSCKENAENENACFSFCGNYTQSPRCSDVDEEDDTERPQQAGRLTRMNDINNGKMTPAPKGRILFDKLDSVANRFSDRSNSQEGSVQNSSVWSESLQRSDSLSPTSSSNHFQDVSDDEEDYLTVIEAEERTPIMGDMKENCQSADIYSKESSVDSSKLEEPSAFCRGWTKVMYFMESILGGSLCAVLAVPVAMVAVKLFSMQEEYHVMVPT